MAIEFGLRGRQHLLEPIEDKDDAFQAHHHPQPPAAATPQPTAPVGHQAQPRSDSGDAGEPGEGQTGHGAAGDGEPGAFDLLQRLGSSPLGPQPDFTRWAANSGHSALNDLPPPQVQAPPPPATGPRVAFVRGQDRYEPDDSFQSWQEEFAPPPAVSATPPPVANLVNVANIANAATSTPPAVTIDLETEGGTTQLLYSANQQAYLAPPPPQFALTATASAAATATSPPPSAPYVGERPADAAWLRDREAALVAVRGDFEAQRSQAQAQPPRFDGPVGPGWVAFTPNVGRDGSEIVPTGLLIVEVRDPNAPAQYSSDENNTYTPPPSQRYVFNEATFTQHYQTQAFANPKSALQTLARRGYDTDAASLLTAHPEIWAIATGDHAINAGPAQAGRAMGDPGQLAQLDLYMADAQISALMQQFGGTPEPARSGISLEQVRVYGEARYMQMTRMANAMQSVRDQYLDAVHQAQASGTGTGPGWSLQPKTVSQFVHGSQDGGVYQDVVVMQPAFDADTFTAWYTQQSGLASQAFKSLYGGSHTVTTVITDPESGSPTSTLAQTRFDNPAWEIVNGGGMAHTELVSLDLNNKPSLRNDACMGFDLLAGWSTAQANIYKKQDWIDIALPIIVVAVVSYFSAGTLGPEAAAAMGMTEAVTVTTTVAATSASAAVTTTATLTTLTATGVVVSAAVAGAATSLVSGMLNNNLTLKGVLIGALTGAASIGALQGIGNVVGATNIAAGTVGGFAANFSVQTGIQALIKGKLSTEIVLTSFASSLGSALALNMEQSITSANLQGAEAFAARSFAKVLTSAVKALGNPDDPNYGFASALLDSVVNGGLDAAKVSTNDNTGNAGAEQRNALDMQSDDAHDAGAAQQSDEILARRGRESGASTGTNTAQAPPPPDPFATISDSDDLARSDLIADQLGVPRGQVSDVGFADYLAQSEKVLWGFIQGAGFSVLDTANSLLEIAKSPSQFINGVQALLNSAEARARLGEEIVNRVRVDVQMLKDAFNDGDLQRTGQQLGKLTADLAQVAGGVEALARLGVSTSTAGGRLVLKAAEDVAFGRTVSLAGPQVRSAELVNRAMVGASKEPAWMPGTQVVTEIVPKGTQYYMVVDAKQAQALENGLSKFGMWATPDAVPSQSFARNTLAISSDFKSDVSYVVRVETTEAQIVSRGFAGPVGGAQGTGSQVQFAEYGKLRLVDPPKPLPGK
jgi:hypothetical protein